MSITSPRASGIGYQSVKLDHPNADEHRREMATAINNMLTGKLNTRITVTLTANAATTTVTDPRIGKNTILHLHPTTANAAAEQGNGTLYQTYPNTGDMAAVLNHANSAQIDRTFACTIQG